MGYLSQWLWGIMFKQAIWNKELILIQDENCPFLKNLLEHFTAL